MVYDPGDVWTAELTVRNAAGGLTAADVTVTVTSPTGTVTTPTPASDSLGVYTVDVALTEPGQWLAVWTVSGAVTGVEAQSIYVQPVTATLPWLPTTDEVHSQIPTRPAFSDDSTPSLADVQNVVRTVANSLAAEFPDMPTQAYPVAKAYVTYSSAAILEAKYDPEQQFGGDTAQMTMLDQRAGVELQRLRSLYASGSGLVAPGARAFTIGGLPDTYRPGVVTPLGYFPAY